MEERYDPDGNISGFCRPILKEQRDKLTQILADNRDGVNKTPIESEIDTQAVGMGDPGFKIGSTLRRTANMVQALNK